MVSPSGEGGVQVTLIPVGPSWTAATSVGGEAPGTTQFSLLAYSRKSFPQQYMLLERHVYKWKNHFSEMKGDVGMSLHEKEGEQEDTYTETGSH